MAAPGDSGSNSYGTADFDSTDAGTGMRVMCWHSNVTTALTAGVSTITFDANFASGNNGYAFKLSGLTAKVLDKSATAGIGGSTAFSSGATASTTADTGCVGVAAWETAATISSAGAGFAILISSVGLDDSRDTGFIFGAFSSGATVTATATMSASVPGSMSVLCYK